MLVIVSICRYKGASLRKIETFSQTRRFRLPLFLRCLVISSPLFYCQMCHSSWNIFIISTQAIIQTDKYYGEPKKIQYLHCSHSNMAFKLVFFGTFVVQEVRILLHNTPSLLPFNEKWSLFSENSFEWVLLYCITPSTCLLSIFTIQFYSIFLWGKCEKN